MDYIIKHRNIDTTKTFDEWKKEQKNNSQKKSKIVNGIDLTLEIANSKLTGTSSTDAYLEFDILVSSNANVYFDDCLMHISYNTTAFGSNLFTNNNVTVTKGVAFSDSTYIIMTASDYTNSVIAINFGSDYNLTSFNRTLISSSPQILLHIKFKIATNGCDNFADINFTDISSTPIWSSYTTTSNAPWTSYTYFDNTIYNGSITDKTCVPIIDNNFTNNIPAGTGQILTITGKYFGERKGTTGTVIFRDANQGNRYPVDTTTLHNYIGIDNYDTLSWSDNKIVIRLPSVLYNLTVLNGDTMRPTPGSGLFKVKNFTSKEKESDIPIIIPYAIYQGIEDILSGIRKVNVKLAGLDSNGYVIHLNPNVTSTFPNAKNVIRKAMKDWSCASGINWQIGSDTTLNSGNDGICIINLGSFSALQRTIPDIRVCQNASEHVYYLKSFDIEIKNPFSNPIYSWQVDTTGNLGTNKYDFYQAIAHELGHGHLLFHANDSLGDIMFFEAWNGFYPESQRKTVQSSSGAANGALYVTDNLVGNLTCVGNHVVAMPLNCSGSVHVNESLNNISVYPNPSYINQNITINFNLDNETYVYFNLYDITGKLLKTTPKTIVKNEDYILPMDGIEKGMYFLQINAGNKRQTTKIIKL